MTIAKKFLLLIVTAMAVLISLAAFEYYKSDKIYRISHATNAVTIPSITTLDAAYSNLVAVRAQVWHIITEDNPARMAEIAQMIDQENASIDMSLNKYETHYLTDATDRQLLETDRRNLQEYRDLQQKTISLSMTGMNRHARDLVIANQRAVNGAISALEQHRQYNVSLADQAAIQAKSLKTTITAFSASTLIAGLLAIAMLGILMLQILRDAANKLDAAAILVNAATMLGKTNTAVYLDASFIHAANDNKR